MSQQRQQLLLAMSFTTEEYENLRQGRIPQQMEDKWFIFLEGDWLYLHRSWSGFCVAQVEIKRTTDAMYSITDCWIERDAKFHTSIGDQADIGLIRSILSFLAARPVTQLQMDVKQYLTQLKNPKPWWKFWQ